MITRRCSERRFFMRPGAATNEAFMYCLAVAAERFGVRIIFTVAMSNHHHTGVIDVEGRLPEFLALFHKLFAKHQNSLLGRWENFWSREQTSAVKLLTTDDVLDKLTYALSNPVKDGLVERIHHWPGVLPLHHIVQDEPIKICRPRRFFRENSVLPKWITLRFARPAGLEGWTPGQYREAILQRLAAVEEQKLSERRKTGRKVLGRKGVLRQPCNGSPASREPHRRLSPRVASKDTWRRIEALIRDKLFLHLYRKARMTWAAGIETSFPHGTYWLRLHAGVPCAPPDDISQ